MAVADFFSTAVDKVRVLEDGEALSVPDSGADASQALAPVY